jgi:hypothetical protein
MDECLRRVDEDSATVVRYLLIFSAGPKRIMVSGKVPFAECKLISPPPGRSVPFTM